jgi:hypothetical protein
VLLRRVRVVEAVEGRLCLLEVLEVLVALVVLWYGGDAVIGTL